MFVPIGLFLFTLFFYLRTLCASFNINDSGETIMDCDQLALAHSPGYPLHTLLGKVACLLPLGQPMFRLTFCSSVMGAFSVVMVYLILRQTFKNTPQASSPFWEIPSVFGALVFAFSFENWFQACGAKGSIYTFNTLFSTLILYLLLKMRDEGQFVKCFWLAIFLFGFGLAVHWETQIVLAPAFVWFFLAAQKNVPPIEFLKNLLRPFDLYERFKRLGSVLGGASLARILTFMLFPLSTYLYLPIRSAQGPVSNWWNPSALKNFLIVVLRGNYAGMGAKRSFVTFHRNLDRFWLQAQHQFGGSFTFVVFLLALVGLAWLFQKQRTNAVGFFLFGASVFGGVVLYNNPPEGYQWTLDNFFTPVYLVIGLFASAGLAALGYWVSRTTTSRWATFSLCVTCLGLALLPLSLNYNFNDQSAYTVSYEEGLNMLKTVNRGGVILCNGDIDILPLWYLQFVEGKRPDVASLTMQMVNQNWYRDDVARRWPYLQTGLQGNVPMDLAIGEMLRSHASERSFYMTNVYLEGASWLLKSYPAIPDGLLWRLVATKDQNFAFTSQRLDQLWSQYQLRNMDPPKRKYWDDYTDIMKDVYGQACSVTGDFAAINKMPEVAKWSYEKALQYHQPQLKGITYLKLANAELSLALAPEAIQHFQESLQWESHGGFRYAPYAYAQMGNAFFLEKDYLDAAQAFRMSLNLNPRERGALDGLEKLERIQGGGTGKS